MKETLTEPTQTKARLLPLTPSGRAYTDGAAPLPATLPVSMARAPGATNLTAGALAAEGVPPKPGLRQMVSALQHRNFRLFWTGQLISLIGTWMQVIARSWLVYQLAANTGNQGLWLGAVGLASSIPVLFLSLYAGVVADRVSRHRIVIATQVSSMVLALLLGVLTATGVVQIWHVLALSVLLGVVNAFDAPARQSFVVELVDKRDLANAIALNSTIFNGARVLGPAVAGIVLALVGPAICFYLNGLSYIAVIIGLLMMQLPKFVPQPQTVSAWQKLAEGLRYIRHDAIVLPLLVLAGISSFFGLNYSTLAPIFADQVLKVGQSGYGLLMAAAGVGALLGALNLAFQSGRSGIRRGRIILIGSSLFSLALCGFALSPVFILSLGMLVAVGWAMISQNATTNMVIQTTTPDHLRGRVMSVYALLFLGVAPAGSLLAGWMADLWGAPATLFISGAVVGLTALVIWRWQPRLTQVQ